MEQTAVEWFYDKIKSHFEHDGDLLETLIFTMEQAKEMEKQKDAKYNEMFEMLEKAYNELYISNPELREEICQIIY